ncbi:MAG: sensor histidine kinase [Rubrobacteraceae bacterium]
MVEELLTLAQMDSWQYSLKLETTELARIIENAIDSVEVKAGRFGIEIQLYDTAVQCTCDTQKLSQVFLNLLDNAVKYSEPGAKVDITVGEDKNEHIVRIKDTGVGIPEADLPHLFERFYRVDKNRSRSTGGSGLGLAISKQIVELHGGGISVASEVGVGTTFTVRLPKAPQQTIKHAV